MAKKKIQAHVPVPLAMVVCDHVHVDGISGKHTIVGTFAHVRGPLPAVIPEMGIYIALTDGRGRLPIQVRLVDVGELRPPIFDIEGTLTFKNPNAVGESGINVLNVTFPKQGDYVLQLIVADKVIMERKVIVDDHIEPEEQ